MRLTFSMRCGTDSLLKLAAAEMPDFLRQLLREPGTLGIDFDNLDS